MRMRMREVARLINASIIRFLCTSVASACVPDPVVHQSSPPLLPQPCAAVLYRQHHRHQAQMRTAVLRSFRRCVCLAQTCSAFVSAHQTFGTAVAMVFAPSTLDRLGRILVYTTTQDGVPICVTVRARAPVRRHPLYGFVRIAVGVDCGEMGVVRWCKESK